MYVPPRLTIPHLLSTAIVLKLILHQMVILSPFALVLFLSEVTVSGGRGSSGTFLVMIFPLIGAMQPIGSLMQNDLVCPWEQPHALAQ